MATKILYDWDGKPHKYEVILHKATEGQDVLWMLLAIAAEPGGAFLQKMLEGKDVFGKLMAGFRAHLKPKSDGDDGTETDAADADIEKILRGADFGSVGQDIRRTLMTSPMSKLARNLLKNTLRDDKLLGEETHFNEAFTGNWGEYLKALLLSIEANRFFALLGIFAELSKKEEPKKSPTEISAT